MIKMKLIVVNGDGLLANVLRYVRYMLSAVRLSVVRLSVVCDVGALYSGG